MADRDETLWGGWAVRGAEHRVFYSGDTALHPELAEIGERLGPFDLTMIDTGAYDELWPDVHLGPEQAVIANQLVRGEVLLPVGWGTFDLANHAWTEPVERAIEAASAHGVPIVTPEPGAFTEPTMKAEVTRWWPETPWSKAQDAPAWSTGVDEVLEEHAKANE
jgi:L-ascorbate metabolism protein UlaG (beta-lactamase superfamily)